MKITIDLSPSAVEAARKLKEDNTPGEYQKNREALCLEVVGKIIRAVCDR